MAAVLWPYCYQKCMKFQAISNKIKNENEQLNFYLDQMFS